MLEALKKLDKKFLIIVGCLLLLPILLIVFLVVIQACSNSAMSYDKYESRMESAAEKYFKEKKILPTNESSVVKVDLNTLVDEGYIKNPSKAVKDDSCTGYVTARLNGSQIESNNGGYINYMVNLNCNDYKTRTLSSLIKEDIVLDGDGVYNLNDLYVYRGLDVDNYITFYGENYRILNMDYNGLVKLLKVSSEPTNRFFDNKYNATTNDVRGINTYSDSSLRQALTIDYNDSKKFKKSAKKHIVSHEVCVGSRSRQNGSLNYDCSTPIGPDAITVMDVTDYAKASLDQNCNSIFSKSCINYNYLRNLNIRTWTYTGVDDNNYGVFYLSSGVAKVEEAKVYDRYNIVLYIDGDEIVESGNGTQSNPFIIK